MKYLLTGVAAIAMLTACGDKDKPVDGAGSEYATDAAKDVKARKGDPATAPQALAAFALDEADDSRISFGSSTLNGDKAVFTDVTLLAGDDVGSDGDEDGTHLDGADVKAKKLEFDGLAMIDGKASFSRMVMSDISLVPTDPEEAEDGSASIGSIELVNPSPALAAWVASVFADAEPADMPTGEALSFDLWTMNDMNMQIDEDDGESGTFLVDTISVSGMKNQKAAQMMLKGLKFDMFDPEDDMTVKANLSNVDIRGFDWSVFAPAEGDSLEDSFESGFMAGMNPKDPANPGYKSINLKDLNFDVSGVNFDMPSLVSNVSHDKQGRAVKVITEPVKMVLNAGDGELGQQLGTQLATLGYEKLELTMASEQAYDPDADVVTLEKGKNYWELKDGFRLNFGAKYEGASAMAAAQAEQDMDSADPSAMLGEVMEKLTLHSIDLSLDDDGIVDRAFNAYAAQSGEDPQQLRNQTAGLLAMAPMMASGSGIDMELATEASTALSSFITDPKTLTISLNPATPIKMSTFAEMEDPSTLTKSALGFSASNE
ncbi:hypothetical protein [uncultured Hyphomonas sp.]|uniref:hypothetical protein n=1 Tax=uncultured Hyphomonas sp. TaxID=225298 RepID=UPI00261C9FC5|nr:hypothetical protein [uncultured Hyphomonas sp.]